jgi:hypothetical protein
MHRRQFVRLTAGGLGLAAVAGAAGCAEPMPSGAIEAWRGPGDEPDVRRWILGYAILAPHSHNLQSWLIDLGTPNEIVLACDLSRLLPETDPQSRQIMMSHGSFLELLDLAARERGLRAEIALFPQGPFGPDNIDQRPVARVRLVADLMVKRDPLFEQILHRRTNREIYGLDQPVAPAAWQAMADAARSPALQFGFVGMDQPSTLAQHRQVAAEAWRIELSTPRTVLESYQVLRVGADEVDRYRDGLVMLDPLIVLASRFGLFDRSKAPAPNAYAITSQIHDFDKKLASTPGFLWMVSSVNSRVAQVNAGRAYARVQLAATAQGLAMQPLQQALQEYPEQAAPYAAARSLLGASMPAQKVQMWARVGYGAAVDPAPRRGVQAQLVTGH